MWLKLGKYQSYWESLLAEWALGDMLMNNEAEGTNEKLQVVEVSQPTSEVIVGENVCLFV